MGLRNIAGRSRPTTRPMPSARGIGRTMPAS